MKSFFHSIWPKTIPSQVDSGDEITVLRERIIQSFSIISLWVGIAVLVLILPTYIQAQRWGLIGVYFACLVSMCAVTFIRRIPYRIRGSIILVVVYAIALGSLLVYGLSGNGPVMLIGFVGLSVMFLGTRPGIGAAMVAFGTMAGVGMMMVDQILPLPSIEIQANARNLSDWVNRTLVVSLLAVFFTISLTIIIKGLRNALMEQKKIGLELNQERKLLEERVLERTSELERRASELETASKIARDISQINELDELLLRAVDLIQFEYHLYHTGIYLTDSHHEYATLRSSAGEAGRTMMAMNLRISLSDAHPVAMAIAKNEIRLSQDTANEPLFVQNPLLPETRAQLAIPLVAGGKVIGALDAQSSARRFFNPNDIRSLQITTDQLAVAIEKAMVVQLLTTALAEMRESYRHSTQEAWQGFHRASRRNFSYRIHQGKVDTTPLALLKPNDAVEAGKTLIQKLTDPQTGNPYTIITLPIVSRGLALGTMELRFNSGQLSSNIVELLESVANRLALAIENARLIEENQIKAARDHLVSDISSKVRAEADIDQVMRIVANELGRSLGVSDVIVQLRENER